MQACTLYHVYIYVFMYTNEKNRDFTITVDGNRTAQLFNTYKPLINAIKPVKIGSINMYPPELELIEIQSGSYLSEDDIVRFEDVYGRSSK